MLVSSLYELTDRRLCRCSTRDGYTRLEGVEDPDLWVCPRCGGPTWTVERHRVGLAFFRGGPLDGKAYETQALLTNVALGTYIIEYNWTPEIIVSELTGAHARVWTFKNLPPADFAEEDIQPLYEKEVRPMTAEVDGSQLLERRLELELSREDVAKHCDLTVAQIARIERSGKRNTEAEVTQINAALDKFASGAAQAAPRRGGRRSKPSVATAAPSGDSGAEEGGDTKGPLAPPPPETGSCRLHEWNGLRFEPVGRGQEPRSGTPVKVTTIPKTAFTFIAFTRNEAGNEMVEVWETRRRRIRYVKPEAVVPVQQRRRRQTARAS